ncbi:MAG TPA: Cys-tRNA(Pro) deacylase [Clostridiales bacterium]|nr:Cys-tRNA(Pro) deacylase [Clostridiales bacterium]
MKSPKTNAMRHLDQAGIDFEARTYEYDENDLSGLKAARTLNLPPDMIYKTLVAHGDRTGYLVCCIAVNREVDLKALAALSGDKRVDMIPVKDLLPLTGYLRGGCSPVGMKRQWPTFLDERALLQEKIAVSAGQRGCQMILTPGDLIRITGARTGSISRQSAD